MSPAGFTVSPPGPNCAHTLDGGNGSRGRGIKKYIDVFKSGGNVLGQSKFFKVLKEVVYY